MSPSVSFELLYSEAKGKDIYFSTHWIPQIEMTILWTLKFYFLLNLCV